MYENEYFKEYVRWAIYTIAKFALCQLNMCVDVVLGITEYTYVCKETNNLIKHINYHLKQDEEFLTASKMLTPSIMPSWKIDPDRILVEYKNANSISKEERAAFLRPSTMSDSYLITKSNKEILKRHLEDIISAYGEIGYIERVIPAGRYLIDTSTDAINVPDQFKVAKDLLEGEYDEFLPLDEEQSMFVLDGANFKARGLL